MLMTTPFLDRMGSRGTRHPARPDLVPDCQQDGRLSRQISNLSIPRAAHGEPLRSAAGTTDRDHVAAYASNRLELRDDFVDHASMGNDFVRTIE